MGAAQINDALQQLDKVTQINAGASEEMSSTSEELASQAEELQTSLSFFRTNSSGNSRMSMPRIDPLAVRKSQPVKGLMRKPALKQPVAAQQARARGFALDLTTGAPDEEDDRFRSNS